MDTGRPCISPGHYQWGLTNEDRNTEDPSQWVVTPLFDVHCLLLGGKNCRKDEPSGMYAHTHTHTHIIHTHKCARTHTHTHTQMHTHTRTYACTRTHTNAHAHTHTRTYARTHTHTCEYGWVHCLPAHEEQQRNSSQSTPNCTREGCKSGQWKLNICHMETSLRRIHNSRKSSRNHKHKLLQS